MLNLNTIEWKPQIIAVIEVLIAFYLSTFCLGMYFIHSTAFWHPLSISMLISYLITIILSIYKVLSRLSLPAIMFAAPILPLAALILVLTLFPIWQWLKI